MNRGSYLVALILLLNGSCQHRSDASLLNTVDSTYRSVRSAALVLDEIGRSQFMEVDSVLGKTSAMFLECFRDTLDRPTAGLLGDQFVQLRSVSSTRPELDRIRAELEEAEARLQALRSDMVDGVMDPEAQARAVAHEKASSAVLHNDLLALLEHHANARRVLARQALVDSVLAVNLDRP